jgi:hypothetical protein
MARLDDIGAVRIPTGVRAAYFTGDQLDGMLVWLELAHRALEDCQTWKLAGGGMLVVDETDGGELHLDADAVAHFMECSHDTGNGVMTRW